MQASMIEIRAAAPGSQLHDGWMTHRVEILNPSNQPITDLSATYRGAAVAGVSGSLSPGATRLAPLAPAEGGVPADMVLQHVTVLFTDAAGTRWRRDGTGGLRRGVLMSNGEWRWTDREDPVITPSRAYDFPASAGHEQGQAGGVPDWAALADTNNSRRRRAPLLWSAGVVLAVAAVVALVVVLLG
jgi:hypothetical protein